MLANYHTHTFRCRHAQGEDREYVEKAIQAGMQVLGFSDHCPWIFPDGYVSGTRMLPQQLDDYFTSIDKLKQEYQNDITIYCGFESEYLPEMMEAQQKLLADYPVDYMILGQHFICNEMYGTYTGFPTNSEEDLRRYVDLIIEGVQTNQYCYVAHPDLMHFTGSEEVYEREYTRLCNFLKEKEMPIEINLLGVLEKRHYTSQKFLEIAKKAGNCVIIGCDAHQPERLQHTEGIEHCLQLAQQFQLKIQEFLPNLLPYEK